MEDDEWSDEEWFEQATAESSASLSESTHQRELHQVIRESRAVHAHETTVQHIHDRRLQNLLTANGLIRIKVPGDGNCFFEASSFHVEREAAADSLRANICNHILENTEHYSGFFHFPDCDENERFIRILEMLEDLKHSGHWNSTAGDLLPLALANLTERPVKIFTSRSSQPVIDIRPSISPVNVRMEPIYLALTAPRHLSQHYDACIKKANIASVTRVDHGRSTRVDGAEFIPTAEGHITPDNASSTTPDGRSTPDNASSTIPDGRSTPDNASSTTPDGRSTPDNASSTTPDGRSTPDNASSTTPDGRSTSDNASSTTPDGRSTPDNASSTTPDGRSTPDNASSPTLASHFTAPTEPTSSASLIHDLGTPEKAPSPRKEAMYVTPPKKNVSRKRMCNPHKWKDNVRKAKKLRGQSYTKRSGEIARPKTIKEVNCSKCKQKCTNKISNEQRHDIFNHFYSLSSHERQKNFVCQHVKETKTRTILNENKEQIPKRRQVSRKFFFVVEGERKYICKKLFTGTLDISNTYIDNAMTNSCNGSFCGSDGRGRRTPANKISKESMNVVRMHIESFPAVDSHYCRKNTNRKFLDCNLSIAKMYQMYKKECLDEDEVPVKEDIYRRTFNTEYNYSFHRPKKDQCKLCSAYREKKTCGIISQEEERTYLDHRSEITKARMEKENDKERAKQDSSVHVATFDLEAVLATPCSLVSQSYYKRKLGVYNLSFFSLGDKRATCFLWNETEGRKGACEISTCLNTYLRSLSKLVKHVVFYSDCCGGQNRNQIVSASLLYAVQNLPIEVIDQKFLISGHTQMESDTIHQRVEKVKTCTSVYVPHQWDTVVQMARKTDPFTVVPLCYTDIVDFKSVASTTVRNPKINMQGNRVQWLNIRWLRYCKSDPEMLYYKYHFEDDFEVIKITGNSSRRNRSGQSVGLANLYTQKLPVSEQKKRDLLDLCRLGIVPSQYHDYYKELSSNKSAPDRLLTPDEKEDEEDEYDTD